MRCEFAHSTSGLEECRSASASLSRVVDDRERFQYYLLRMLSVLVLLDMGIGMDFALARKDRVLCTLGRGGGYASHIFGLFGPGIDVILLYTLIARFTAGQALTALPVPAFRDAQAAVKR
jgi:hypothetical protein